MATQVHRLHRDATGGWDERPLQNDPLIAFTAEQVLRVTGLSDHQLRYWDRTGFFSPSYVGERHSRPYTRIYEYRDVVGLRTISRLRNEHQVPLQELRKVGTWLKERYNNPWSALRFFVIGRRVYFEDPDSSVHLLPKNPSQAIVPIEMQANEVETRERALQLRERSADEIGSITRHRYVVSNAWVLAGTRIPTEAIWNFHIHNHTTASILTAYPSLTPVDVQNAIEFEQHRRLRQKAG